MASSLGAKYCIEVYTKFKDHFNKDTLFFPGFYDKGDTLSVFMCIFGMFCLPRWQSSKISNYSGLKPLKIYQIGDTVGVVLPNRGVNCRNKLGYMQYPPPTQKWHSENTACISIISYMYIHCCMYVRIHV